VAARHGIEVSPHNPTGPIAHAHTVHVCTALGLQQAVEHQFGESPLFQDGVVGSLPAFEGGHFTAVAAPGLGLALNPQRALEHPPSDAGLLMTDPSFA
jgi:galactonate dehydratase